MYFRLFSLLLLVQASTLLVDGSEFLLPSSCKNFTVPASSDGRVLCFSGSGTGPSPAAYENGTTVYLGGFSWNYVFEKDLTGLSVAVVLNDNETCTVSVNGEDCESCIKCASTVEVTGDVFSPETFTAHCTNLDQGRHVQCEPVSPVFFPLVATYGESTGNSTAAEPVSSPTVASPVAAPTGSATVPSGTPAASGAAASVFSKFAASLLLIAMVS
jgi:hypothetical protein